MDVRPRTPRLHHGRRDTARVRARVERAAAAAVAVAAVFAAARYQPTLDVLHPAVLRVEAPAPARARRVAGRVVWVLVDGLRRDASLRMPALNHLRASGQALRARSEFPTYSVPNFVAQASGVEPDASGVRSNRYPRRVALDSVFRLARGAGLGTCAVATGMAGRSLARLYEPWLEDVRVADPIPGVRCGDLVFVHVDYADEAAHASGADGPEYAAAVARADATIANVARELDPARDTLIVTSDHGHLARGGHGGTEAAVVDIPIVLWGAGVPAMPRSGVRPARDVGPTIAWLLGLGPLRHATGRSLLRETAAAARQRAAVHRTLRASRTGGPTSGIAFCLTALASTFVLAALARERKRGPSPSRLLGASTYAIVFAGLLCATHTLSFSASNEPVWFAARLALLCGLAGLAQLAVGRRASLAPAAAVAALAVSGSAVLVARSPIVLAAPTSCFLPIPAFGALAFIAAVVAAVGPQESRSRTGRARHPGAVVRLASRREGRPPWPRRPSRVTSDGIGELKPVRR